MDLILLLWYDLPEIYISRLGINIDEAVRPKPPTKDILWLLFTSGQLPTDVLVHGLA